MRKSTQTNTPLSAEARDLIARLAAEYDINDAAGRLILQTAGEALARMRQAQAAIAADGPVTVDRFGQRKAHPLLATERDSRAALLSALKALNLDLEPLRDAPGRPPGRK